MASQDHRVEKLEADIYTSLSPEDRVSEVLKALVEGKEDVAARIVDLCPHRTCEMTDHAYSERLRNIAAIGVIAVGEFEKYAFAWGQVEKAKNIMAEAKIAAIMPSYYHDLMVDAITQGENGGKIGWDHLKGVARNYTRKVPHFSPVSSPLGGTRLSDDFGRNGRALTPSAGRNFTLTLSLS